jgi:hypothetical protein
MDYALIIYIISFICLSGLTVFLRINAAKIKGWFGEKNIVNRLKQLDKDKYETLNDIFLESENGNTSQIDHLVISVYGIFVIETKNYKGWIFGNEKSDKWTQVIYNQRNYFRNPIKQNWSHIYMLKSLLREYRDLPYFPVVVFAGSAILKEIVSKVPVIYDSELIDFIENYSDKICMSIENVHKICSFIQNASIDDKKKRKEHIENIHSTIVERQIKIQNLICPRCNGKLKLREGRTGKFYGCSNYPKCRFTMPYRNNL